MSVINTNVLSLTAQNNLERSQSSLATAIQRLSSGLKINSAKDDAAGQAIANRFTANINGLDKARSNANDAISLAQTTEGALKEINNNLLRIRELTVQALNGTNSASDRSSMQDEILLRLEEIDRVSAQTQFNGTKVLSKDQRLDIQVGANDRETISIGMAEISSKTLSLDGFSVEKPATLTRSDAPHYYTNGVTITGLAAEIARISPNGGHPVGGVRLDQTDGQTYVEITGSSVGTENGMYLVNVDPMSGAVAFRTKQTPPAGNPLQNIIEAHPELDANVVGGNLHNTKMLTLTSDDGSKTLALESQGKLYAYNLDAIGKVTVKQLSYTDTDGSPVTANIELGGADGKTGVVTTNIGSFFAKNLANRNLTVDNLKPVENPTRNPLKVLDAALSKVDKHSSNLGAVQNRLQSTIANLSNTTENLQAARSRIMDANYATEVSNMSRAQIIQKAGMSVLAQANQVSQDVLSLLR